MTTFDDQYEQLSAAQRELLDTWLAAEAGAAAAGNSAAGASAAPYAAPSTEPERILADVWRDVLELRRVGVDDDYFAVGGDSIHAIVIVAKAEAAGLRIGTQDLFEARTIRRLAETAEIAEAAEAAEPAEIADAAPGAPEDAAAGVSTPLSPLQEGMLFHALAATRAVYVVQVTCELVGDLDVDAFHRAWDVVVDRHAALRGTFHWSDGQAPVQRQVPHAAVPLDFRDWRSLPPRRQDEELRRHLDADAAYGFDLTAAPLLRLALFRTADGVHRCVWTHHHLLLDGWSQHLVLADVLDAYAELRAGRAPRVPSRRSGADYAAALAERDPPDAARFWRDHLAGYSGPAPLPRSQTPSPGAAANAVTAHLPEASTAALSGFCRANGLTVGTVVLGGTALLLARLTGADDVVFGATVSGRSAALPGITEAVGMFINTLPVRVPCRPADRLLPWLRELHDDQLTARRYEQTPLSRIARWSQVAPGRPLFESIVVLENFPSRFVEVHAAAGLRIRGAEAFVDEGYPLVLEVTPAASLLLRARFDRDRLTADSAGSLVDALRGFLADAPAHAELPLAELSARIDAHLRRHAAAERSAVHLAAAGRLRSSRRQPVRTEEA